MDETFKVVLGFVVVAIVIGLTTVLMARHGLLPSWKSEAKEDIPDPEKKE